MPSTSSKNIIDLLLTKNVPHILINVFLQLNPSDFKQIRIVCKLWRDFVDDHILSNPSLREKLLTRDLVERWHNDDLVQHALEPPKCLQWNQVDVRGICCSGNEIFFASGRDLYWFKDLKMVKKFSLPETEKVRRCHVGERIFLLATKTGNRSVILDRKSMSIVRTFSSKDLHIQSVEGKMFFVRSSKEELSISELDDVTGLERHRGQFSSKEMVPEDVSITDLTKSRIVVGKSMLVVVHEDGWINLISHSNHAVMLMRKYSSCPDNLVKNAVLTDSFCGVIFFRVVDEQTEPGVNFRVFCVRSGELMASADGVATYGRTYFSATKAYFVFSYADAMHNQHFLLYKISAEGSRCQKREFVLLDRPQPMRSMQILREKLLILSFYRTASALNIFDLDRLIQESKNELSSTRSRLIDSTNDSDSDSSDSQAHHQQLEFIKRLPVGIIAFQSSHDECNSQRLVVYKDSGILCQRLDYSCENLVLALGEGEKEEMQQQQQKRREKIFIGCEKMFRFKWK